MSKSILITGANGGFGKLTVLELLKRGHEVVGSMRAPAGRNAEVAHELKEAGATVVEIDVTDDNSVARGVSKAIETLGHIDVLINNAGVGVLGMQEHFTPDDWKKLFDINVFGVQRVTRAALPEMRRKGSGLIIFVSSLLGRLTLPFYGPYNASKWALEGMAETYRAELSAFGLQSCIVEPGGYPTSFMDNLMRPSDQSRSASYGEFMNAPAGMFEGFEQAMQNNPDQKPTLVALALADLIDQPPADRPFRTVVDKLGMGEVLTPYNDQLEQVMKGIYGNFGMGNMLEVE